MAISDAEFEEATRRAERLAAAVPAVVAARYERRKRELQITFASRMVLLVPVEIVQGLADAAPADLAEIVIEAGGLSLHWPQLDADLWVPALLSGITGTRRWMAAVLGAQGGAARTKAKAEAARRNGTRGGRPRKKAAA
jgi:Protein of unknown function (DUF2442)